MRRIGGQRLELTIVETEAYLGEGDRASHAWNGRRTKRSRNLFVPGGLAYVYLIYGMYNCLNAVTGSAEDGHAVLIRAGMPCRGLASMQARRGLRRDPKPGDLAGGPGKLCQAIAVDRDLNGMPLDSQELSLHVGDRALEADIVSGPRIGIDYAGEAASWPLRFAWRGNLHVSRPRPW